MDILFPNLQLFTGSRFAPNGAQLMSMVWIKRHAPIHLQLSKKKHPHGFSFELCGLLREVGMFFSLGWLGFLILRLHTAGFEKCFILVVWGVYEPQIFSEEHCPFDSREKNLLFEKILPKLVQPKESINLRSQLSSGWVEIMFKLSEVLLLVVQTSGDHQLRLVVYLIPFFTRFYTSQVVVWDFFHQQ